MRTSVLLINSLVGAVIVTLVTATATLLILMFSTSADAIRREGMFGAVYFQTSPGATPDITQVRMGVARPISLLGFAAVVFLFLIVVQLIYRRLAEYRSRLVQEHAHS